MKEERAYFSSENLLRSTLSSGAVIKSMSCPISVWYVVCHNKMKKFNDIHENGSKTKQHKRHTSWNTSRILT